jgi:hypothetical protein
MRHGFPGSLAAEKDKGEAIVSPGSLWLLLQHVPVRLRRLVHHADPGVADGDLLQYDGIARRLFERETK